MCNNHLSFDAQILKMIENRHYLYRMTILVAISLLAPIVGNEVVNESMLPVLMAAAKDPVPNVKFSVAKTLQKMVQESIIDDHAVSEVVRPCLQELCKDEDIDVKYFANQALGLCDVEMAA